MYDLVFPFDSHHPQLVWKEGDMNATPSPHLGGFMRLSASPLAFAEWIPRWIDPQLPSTWEPPQEGGSQAVSWYRHWAFPVNNAWCVDVPAEPNLTSSSARYFHHCCKCATWIKFGGKECESFCAASGGEWWSCHKYLRDRYMGSPFPLSPTLIQGIHKLAAPAYLL